MYSENEAKVINTLENTNQGEVRLALDLFFLAAV